MKLPLPRVGFSGASPGSGAPLRRPRALHGRGSWVCNTNPHDLPLIPNYLHKKPLPIHYNLPLGALFVRPLFGGQYENPRLRALFGGWVWCGVSLGFGAGLVWLLV